MRKRLLSIVLSMAMTFSMVSCGSSESAGAGAGDATTGEVEKEVVTVWGWDPNFTIKIMNYAKEIYEKDNPNVEINVVEMAPSDIEQKMHTMLSSGQTKDLPEIVLTGDSNVKKYLKSYPNAFADLTEKLPYDEFAKSKVKIVDLDGKKYGVPFDSGVAGYYYRVDLLEAAGFKSEDLENITWDRFVEIGKEVLAKTGKPMMTGNPNDLSLVGLMLQSAGSWYFDEDGKPNIANNAALKESLELMKEMYDSGIQSMEFSGEDMIKKINGGEVVGHPSGIWFTPTITQAEEQSGLWKLAPVPRLTVDGAVNATNHGGSSFMILNESKGKDAAIDFLSKIFTNEAFYQEILVDVGAVCSHIPSNDGEAYSKKQEFFGGQAIFADAGKWMAEIPEIDFGLYSAETQTILQNEFTAILEGKDISEVLKSVEEQVKAQINQ